MFVMLSFLVIAMVGTAQSHSPEQCKLDVRAAKQIEINLRIEALNEKRRLRNLEQQLNAPETPAAVEPNQAEPSSSGAFGGVFNGLGQDD